jgi:hypothetical protein
MLFSATSSKKTEDLIKLALKKEPIYIGLEDQAQDGAATVKGLEQVRDPGDIISQYIGMIQVSS